VTAREFVRNTPSKNQCGRDESQYTQPAFYSDESQYTQPAFYSDESQYTQPAFYSDESQYTQPAFYSDESQYTQPAFYSDESQYTQPAFCSDSSQYTQPAFYTAHCIRTEIPILPTIRIPLYTDLHCIQSSTPPSTQAYTTKSPPLHTGCALTNSTYGGPPCEG
jgi:hypothetical protein